MALLCSPTLPFNGVILALFVVNLGYHVAIAMFHGYSCPFPMHGLFLDSKYRSYIVGPSCLYLPPVCSYYRVVLSCYPLG